MAHDHGSSGHRPHVHVHLDHGRSPDRWRERYARGEVGSPTSYGYEYAGDLVHLAFSRDGGTGGLAMLVRRASRFVVGFDLLHLLANRRAMAASDAIWTHTEYEWAGIALLKRLGLLRRPVLIAQSVWLWDRWHGRSPRLLLWRWAAGAATAHVTLSPVNAAEARTRTRRPVVFVPFGIDPPPPAPTRTPAPQSRIEVVAPGNDPDRDWETLVEAARRDPLLHVRILSSRFRPKHPLPPSVQVQPARGAAEVREAVASAHVVAIPLRTNGHASGITVALEGLAARRPLAVTDTGGIDAYLADLAALTRPSDPDALATAIRRAAAAPPLQGDPLVDRGLTDLDYARRLALLTLALLDGAPIPAAVSRFAPVDLA